MNWKKLIEEIDELVNNDFGYDMETKLLPGSKKYTQKEAREMANTLSRVYSLSHRVHCGACRRK